VDYTEDITVLSLCAGYGGIELGLSAALENPMRIVAVEVEAYALANLVAKAETNKLAIEALWPDLRTFPKERFRGCFDIITAGYPCQPESCAGKRKGKADPRYLWPDIERIVQAVEPVWCFFENVGGHLTGTFPTVLRSLRDMGYKVEAGLFTAAECGAPHRRQRLFILAKSSRATSGNQNRQIKRGTRQADVSQGHRQACTVRFRAASQLAYAETAERRGLSKKYAGRGIEKAGRPNGSELADTDGTRPQAEWTTVTFKCREFIICNHWPARPGQPQYEWEEPRVVGDALQRNNRTRQLGKSRQSVDKRPQCNSKETQSRLGRAVDRTSGRMDRLRLLGNGVVPQQAEKAFRYLMEKF